MSDKPDLTDIVLEVRDLRKAYGAVDAVRGVSFAVPRGAFYGFFGRNGAGKTTTLDIITGLLGRDSGVVSLFGVPFGMEPSPSVKQRFAYVGGHIALYDFLSLKDHLDFVAGFYDAWDADRCTQLQEVFRLPMHQATGTLSPGQHIQFQLLMALSRHPELLLLDEPGNLDPVVRSRLMSTMIEILDRENTTIVMASHLIDELEGVADHMCIIDQGVTLVSGPVARLVSDVRQIHLQGVQTFEAPKLPGFWSRQLGRAEWQVVMPGFTDERAEALAKQAGATSYEVGPVSLEEFFIALTSDRE